MSSLLNVLRDTHTRRVDLHPLREALRLQRQALDWSLDQLADASGVNRHSIHAIENVKRRPRLIPTLTTLEKLAKAMGMDLSVTVLHIHDKLATEQKQITIHAEALPKGDIQPPISTSVEGAHAESLGDSVSNAVVERIARRAVDLIESSRRSATRQSRHKGVSARPAKSTRRKSGTD